MKEKILITGGAGFIGSHLQDALIKRGYKIIIIDNLSTGKKENINKKAKFYKIDILNPKISEIFKKEKPTIVFHLAAQMNVRKSVGDLIFDAKVNIFGSLNILENCKNFGVKKIIFASSGGAIYGETKKIPTPENYSENPISPYGISKLTVEKYLKFYKENFGLNFISLRFSNVYGPRQNLKSEAGVVTIFIDKLLHNKIPTIFGDGFQTRDFVYVKDVVEAALKALAYRAPISANLEPVFNVGTGIETSINELYNLISQKLKKNIKPNYELAKPGDLKRSCLDFSKIKKELRWQPKYDLEKGLTETIKWFKKT
ncbi:MAG: NAD-dependent epimerase/dehydratase family protein [Minisyncoccia bacterium]